MLHAVLARFARRRQFRCCPALAGGEKQIVMAAIDDRDLLSARRDFQRCARHLPLQLGDHRLLLRIVERQRQLLGLERDAEIEQQLPAAQGEAGDRRRPAADVADQERDDPGAVRLSSCDADADQAVFRQRLRQQEGDRAVRRNVDDITHRGAWADLGDDLRHRLLDEVDMRHRRHDRRANLKVQQLHPNDTVSLRHQPDDQRGRVAGAAWVERTLNIGAGAHTPFVAQAGRSGSPARERRGGENFLQIEPAGISCVRVDFLCDCWVQGRGAERRLERHHRCKCCRRRCPNGIPSRPHIVRPASASVRPSAPW